MQSAFAAWALARDYRLAFSKRVAKAKDNLHPACLRGLRRAAE